MNSVLVILLFLVCVAWISWRELPFCFASIKRSGIFQLRTYSLYLLVALLLGTVCSVIVRKGDGCVYTSHEVCCILLAVLITLFYVRVCSGTSAFITALLGACLALSYSSDNGDNYSSIHIALPLLGGPLLGAIAAYGLNKLLRNWFDKSQCHLLYKGLVAKWMLLAGIVIGGILLFYHYFMAVSPILHTFMDELESERLKMGLVFLMLCIFLLPQIFPRKESVFQNPVISHAIASVYALIGVLVVFDFCLCWSGFQTIYALSPVHVVIAMILVLRKDKLQKGLLSLLVGLVITPSASFFICLSLLNLSENSVLLSAFLFVLLLGGIVLQVFLRRGKKYLLVKQALQEEKVRRVEAHEELNRLDMHSVVSQFDILSNKMEAKRRELINLALHVKQQREYMDVVINQLESVATETDVEVMRSRLKEEIAELHENMNFSEEMNHFYTQVDAMHKHFVSKLTVRCPNLTEQEKRLAILLRLGFSSKEISSLLNITPKSVEICRYRFRKRLKLDRNENLVRYIQLL